MTFSFCSHWSRWSIILSDIFGALILTHRDHVVVCVRDAYLLYWCDFPYPFCAYIGFFEPFDVELTYIYDIRSFTQSIQPLSLWWSTYMILTCVFIIHLFCRPHVTEWEPLPSILILSLFWFYLRHGNLILGSMSYVSAKKSICVSLYVSLYLYACVQPYVCIQTITTCDFPSLLLVLHYLCELRIQNQRFVKRLFSLVPTNFFTDLGPGHPSVFVYKTPLYFIPLLFFFFTRTTFLCSPMRVSSWDYRVSSCWIRWLSQTETNIGGTQFSPWTLGVDVSLPPLT